MARKKGSRNLTGKSKCMKGSTKEKKLPRYSEMVHVVLVDMKQQKGSSKKDIMKHIMSKYGLSEMTKVERALDVALKSGVRNGTLIYIDNRYKLVNTVTEKQGPVKKGKKTGTEIVKGNLPKASKRKKMAKKESINQRNSKSKKINKRGKKGIEPYTTKQDSKQDSTGGKLESQNTDHRLLDSPKINARRYYSTDARAPGAKEICQIDAIDVTPDQNVMVLIDSNNRKLKLFDHLVSYRTAYSFEPSEQAPKALAVLNNNEVVVSLFSETHPLTNLMILDISGREISYFKAIPVGFLTVRDIACHEDKIYITGNDTIRADSAFLNLIDRDGKQYWSRSIRGQNKKNACPNCITYLLKDENISVFVVDVKNNRVWKYDGNTGDVLGCYENGNIRRLTSGVELLFGSCSGSKDIYTFGPNMGGKKLIIKGRSFPLCIKYRELTNVFNPPKHRLLVSNHREGNRSLSSYVDLYELLN